MERYRFGDPFLKEAFTPSMRRRVRKEQNGLCIDECGGKIDEIHHRLPINMGGNDSRENAVGARKKHHTRMNKEAQEKGIIYPNIPLSEVPQTLYRKGYKI
ncbi:MAG: HNH endonuclease [archaeon]|nr:HNH endonuclease [archaeon]